MEVLLNSAVPKLGYKGDIVKVKAGYFRNFLGPRGLASFASKAVKALNDSRHEKLVLRKQQLMDNAKEVLQKLKGLKVKISAKVTKTGKLYASITEARIIAAVKEATNVELEKEFLKMKPIKEAGEHTVLVHLGENLEEVIRVSVVAAK